MCHVLFNSDLFCNSGVSGSVSCLPDFQMKADFSFAYLEILQCLSGQQSVTWQWHRVLSSSGYVNWKRAGFNSRSKRGSIQCRYQLSW